MPPRPLSETDSYVLFSEYEDVFLFDKDESRDIWRASMYGDATCGVIGIDNAWAVAGGESLIVWKDEVLHLIEDDSLRYAYDMRQVSNEELEILTDPWSDNAAIWLFNIRTELKTKIRDFNEYKGTEYQDSVDW